MNTLRFGCIGCGAMAEQVHIPNMAAMEGAEIIAYCDLDIAKAEKMQGIYGAEYVTTDVERIFADTTIDGVLIQTGPQGHPTLVQAAANAGKHIFVEKPLAIELAYALETVRVVEASGVKFIFGVCNRLAPMVVKARQMCPNPVYSYCQGFNTVTGSAVHNLDLAVNCFHKAPLQTVFASGRQVWGLDPHLPADSFSAVLTFADGSVHTLLMHGHAPNPLLSKYHFQLFGKDRCIYLANRFKECHMSVNMSKVERSWVFEGNDGDRGPYGYMGHFDELQELVQCIRHGGQGTMTVREAAFALAVEKAVLHSIESGQVVDFPAFMHAEGAAFLLEGRGYAALAG